MAQYAGALILLVVASGWRPRLTAIPHWWVTFSFFASATLPDGGDQLAAILTLLFIPLAVTDPRAWHWDRPVPRPEVRDTERIVRLVAHSALMVARVQIAGVYLHSALGKLAVQEWRDGTALFYWLGDPVFGPAQWLREPLLDLTAQSIFVASGTWGAIALEFALALALVMDRRSWPYLLILGLGFHAVIAVAMGLVSFSLVMSAALIIYLRPIGASFDLRPLPWMLAARRPSPRPIPAGSR